MRLSSGLTLVCLVLVLSSGCAHSEPVRAAQPAGYQRPRPPTPPPAPPMTLLPGAPLPSGWIWPFNLRNAAGFFTPLANVRPIDVSRLVAYRGSGPCSPAEVAPGIWFAPDFGSRSDSRAQLALRSGEGVQAERVAVRGVVRAGLPRAAWVVAQRSRAGRRGR